MHAEIRNEQGISAPEVGHDEGLEPWRERGRSCRCKATISFTAPDLKKKTVRIDGNYVRQQLADIVKDQDLTRYIL